jgi:hypothetical protein
VVTIGIAAPLPARTSLGYASLRTRLARGFGALAF